MRFDFVTAQSKHHKRSSLAVGDEAERSREGAGRDRTRGERSKEHSKEQRSKEQRSAELSSLLEDQQGTGREREEAPARPRTERARSRILLGDRSCAAGAAQEEIVCSTTSSSKRPQSSRAEQELDRTREDPSPRNAFPRTSSVIKVPRSFPPSPNEKQNFCAEKCEKLGGAGGAIEEEDGGAISDPDFVTLQDHLLAFTTEAAQVAKIPAPLKQEVRREQPVPAGGDKSPSVAAALDALRSATNVSSTTVDVSMVSTSPVFGRAVASPVFGRAVASSGAVAKARSPSASVAAATGGSALPQFGRRTPEKDVLPSAAVPNGSSTSSVLQPSARDVGANGILSAESAWEVSSVRKMASQFGAGSTPTKGLTGGGGGCKGVSPSFSPIALGVLAAGNAAATRPSPSGAGVSSSAVTPRKTPTPNMDFRMDATGSSPVSDHALSSGIGSSATSTTGGATNSTASVLGSSAPPTLPFSPGCIAAKASPAGTAAAALGGKSFKGKGKKAAYVAAHQSCATGSTPTRNPSTPGSPSSIAARNALLQRGGRFATGGAGRAAEDVGGGGAPVWKAPSLR